MKTGMGLALIAVGSPEAANHIDATRDLSTEPTGPRPGETEVIEDIYED